MKYTVKNNSSAPHDLMTIKGRVVVLAGKSVEVEFAPEIVPVYEGVAFFDVTPVGSARDPLDHDSDGRKGGFIQTPEPERDQPDEPAKRRGRPPKNKD